MEEEKKVINGEEIIDEVKAPIEETKVEEAEVKEEKEEAKGE